LFVCGSYALDSAKTWRDVTIRDRGVHEKGRNLLAAYFPIIDDAGFHIVRIP
jgi:hypothetical protein